MTPVAFEILKLVGLAAVAPNCLKWHLFMLAAAVQAIVTSWMLGVTEEQKAFVPNIRLALVSKLTMAWLVTALREKELSAIVVSPVWVFMFKSKIAGLPAMFGTTVSLLPFSLTLVRAGAAANGVVDEKPVI